MARARKILSPKQAKAYVELRQLGVSPKRADTWVRKRVTVTGRIKVM